MAGIGGWPIAIIGFMPILGHAYSPFLRFRGGKALASSISVWVVLGGWPVFFIGASVLILGKIVQRNDAWTIMATDFAVLVFLFAIGADPHLFGLWGAITVIVVAKHRKELLESPKIRYFAGDSARKKPVERRNRKSDRGPTIMWILTSVLVGAIAINSMACFAGILELAHTPQTPYW